MKRNFAWIVMGVMVMGVVLTLGLGINQVQGDQQPEPQSAEAPMATDFTLENHDGTTVTLSDLKGKVVVLEWFNDQCPFVVYHHKKNDTMPALAKKYAEKDVVWLAINSSHFADNAYNKKIADKWGTTYKVLNDSAGTVGKAYEAKTTPHMFIIDKEGKVVYNGAIDNKPMGRGKGDLVNYVDKALTELLNGESITVPKTKPYGCSVKYKK